MNKLLLVLSLFAVDCGWDNPSMLIAETQSEVNVSPSATASGTAEDENKSHVLKTSPSGTFRVLQNGEEFWILTAADKNQRTKMHSADLVTPEEFRFSPNKKWLNVELEQGWVLPAPNLNQKAMAKLRDLTNSDLFSPSSHH